MARVSLKNILGKKSDTTFFIMSFIDKTDSSVWIEDENEKLLLGTVQPDAAFSFPVHFDDEIVGWVKGTAKGNLIADLLVHLLTKEAERKKLGTEVLNLYKEVNLIFNFSEKLAQTIEASTIASVTLEEASHVISCDYGVVVLWDEKSKGLQVAASQGSLFFDEHKINLHLPLLIKIIFSGQSEILSQLSELTDEEIILPQVKSILYSALKVNHRVMGAIILASNIPEQYTAADLKLLTTLALQSSAAIESALLFEKNIREAREREEALRKVYEATAKFVPHEFINSLGHNFITDIKLGDHVEKIVTVLFSDIRDFTTISERMTPQENFKFVCSFNERMGPIIKRHGGFINQYLGDAIMAIFPGTGADALSAAIEMQKEVDALNTLRESNDQPLIKIGVGMHTGPLIMGITGDLNRMDATTISDTVNTASRIESLTKHYKAAIILSDACLLQIEDKEKFYLRNLGRVQLKGKQETVKIHECFSGNSAKQMLHKKETLNYFNEGIMHYLAQSFEKAAVSFKWIKAFQRAGLVPLKCSINKKSNVCAGVSKHHRMLPL